MLLPHEIRKKEFSHAIGGYAKSEVKSYLEYVAAGYEKLRRENDELSRKLEAACAGLDEYHKKEAEANAKKTECSLSDKAVGERIASLRRDEMKKLEEAIESFRTELSSIEKLLVSGDAPAIEAEEIEEIEEIEGIEGIEIVSEDIAPKQTVINIGQVETIDTLGKESVEDEIEEEPTEEDIVPEVAELTWGELEDALTAAFGSLTPTDEAPDPDQIKIGEVPAEADEVLSIDIGDIIIEDEPTQPESAIDGIELTEDDFFADIKSEEDAASAVTDENSAEEDDTLELDSFMSDFLGDVGGDDVFEFVIPTEEPEKTEEAITTKDADDKPAKPVYKKRTYKISRKSKKKSAPVTDEEAEALLEALKERYKSYDAKTEAAAESDDDDASFDTQNYDEFNYFFADTTEKIDTVPTNNDINDI